MILIIRGDEMIYQINGLKDVAFEIMRYDHEPTHSKPHKLKVAWWNVVSSHPPYPMCQVQQFALTDEQWGSRTSIIIDWEKE